jgi:hypothetical protein
MAPEIGRTDTYIKSLRSRRKAAGLIDGCVTDASYLAARRKGVPQHTRDLLFIRITSLMQQDSP